MEIISRKCQCKLEGVAFRRRNKMITTTTIMVIFKVSDNQWSTVPTSWNVWGHKHKVLSSLCPPAGYLTMWRGRHALESLGERLAREKEEFEEKP